MCFWRVLTFHAAALHALVLMALAVNDNPSDYMSKIYDYTTYEPVGFTVAICILFKELLEMTIGSEWRQALGCTCFVDKSQTAHRDSSAVAVHPGDAAGVQQPLNRTNAPLLQVLPTLPDTGMGRC